MNSRIRSNIMLMVTALIWGSAFVAQRVGMDYIGPFTFNSIRCFLGAIVLIPVILVMEKKDNKNNGAKREKTEIIKERKTLLCGGLFCGAALAVASSLQQIGLVYTPAGKAGFITALYILIVPILGFFIGKRAGAKIWTGVAIAVVGMYFLCLRKGLSISCGDFFVILCAFVFSVHIILIDYFSPKVDGVKLSCIQFAVSAVLCAVPMLILEKPLPGELIAAAAPLLYAGILSCGVAYTLQIIAQKDTDPTVASLILSLESVFAVLAGWILIHEKLTGREIFGCVLMFAAIIIAQLPEKKRGKFKENAR